MNHGSVLLTGRGLHKSFGPTPALRGVDVSVKAGEVLAVMGPSGAGKSTLLHCLAGILTPDSGEVTFDGQRIDRLPDRERSRLRRTAFGFVFQFGQLVPEPPTATRLAVRTGCPRHPKATAFFASHLRSRRRHDRRQQSRAQTVGAGPPDAR